MWTYHTCFYNPNFPYFQWRYSTLPNFEQKNWENNEEHREKRLWRIRSDWTYSSYIYVRVCRECELKYKHTYYPDKEKKKTRNRFWAGSINSHYQYFNSPKSQRKRLYNHKKADKKTSGVHCGTISTKVKIDQTATERKEKRTEDLDILSHIKCATIESTSV